VTSTQQELAYPNEAFTAVTTTEAICRNIPKNHAFGQTVSLNASLPEIPTASLTSFTGTRIEEYRKMKDKEKVTDTLIWGGERVSLY
jgi:hypothetical protein